jgi:hypothetical protein
MKKYLRMKHSKIQPPRKALEPRGRRLHLLLFSGSHSSKLRITDRKRVTPKSAASVSGRLDCLIRQNIIALIL